MSSEFDDLFDDIGPLADVDPITMLDVLQSTQIDVGPLYTSVHDFPLVNPVEFQFGDQAAQTEFSIFPVSTDALFRQFGNAAIDEILDSVPTEMSSSTEIVPFENVTVTAAQEDCHKRR
jgi:hypothetical protein